MGLRFQKRMQIFPGVRLNFSRSGVSATIGVPGASVTVGRDGVHANAGAPGTGVSYRKKIASWPKGKAPAAPSDTGALVENDSDGDEALTLRATDAQQTSLFDDCEDAAEAGSSPPHAPLREGFDAIESEPMEEVASAGLEELHDLIEDAGRHRRSLKKALGEARHALRRSESDLAKASSWWRRWFSGSKIPDLEQAVAVYQAEVEDLYAALDACVIDLDLSLPPLVLDAFIRMAKAFDELQNVDVIWDVTAQRDDGRLDADDLERSEVDFFFADSALLKCKMRAMLFGNANGADMHVYPAFVLLRDHGDGFALIDPRDLVISYDPVTFVEKGPVPADAKVIGDAWEQVTRNGARDKRFKRNNRQLPKVLYGALTVYSRDGVNERWMVSNAAAAERFVRSWIAYQKSLPDLDNATYRPMS